MPDSKEVGGSVFNEIADLKERVTKIEGKDEKTHFRLTTLEEKYEKLSETITSENRETRATMRDTTDKLFAIISTQTTRQSTAEENEFSLEREKLALKKEQTNLWITNGFKLLSAGGVIYLIIEAILTN